MRMGMAAAALAAGLLACSDDKDKGGGATSLTKAQLRDYCAKVLRVETFPFPAVGQQSEAERAATFSAYALQLRGLVEDAAEAAPEKTRADLTTVAGALDDVAEAEGDLTKRGTPAVRAAANRAHAFDVANCGWSRVDTAGVEYAFEGFPATVPSGVVSFELAGKGAEPHVLELYRINDDVTASGREIFEGGVPSDEDLAKVADIGSAFAQPGENGYVVRDLEPGRYVAACLISLGGEPLTTHATRGMLAEFSVD